MRGNGYRNILILIVLTGVLLTAAQVYFTFQNYKVNKQRFINDVQIALDLSIEKYFAERARKNFYFFKMDVGDTLIKDKEAIATVTALSNVDSILKEATPSIQLNRRSGKVDSNKLSVVWSQVSASDDTSLVDSIIHNFRSTTIKNLGESGSDDIELTSRFEHLTQKVMISISEELLDIGKLFVDVEEELKRKNLSIDFAINQRSGDRTTSVGTSKPSFLTTTAKSSYLGSNRSVDLDFENSTLSILSRGISDLVISVLLIGWVMGSMIHLYRTIGKQKQIAEIKDDLISNITHEFKTPIATISSALEGITHFNEDNDLEKTKRYLSVSNDQLGRLNGMVEKLLETAALDKRRLELNLEEIDLVAWTQKVVQRFNMISNGKRIVFECIKDSLVGKIDLFHFENAIGNLVDNAIKYGGENIVVRLNGLDAKVEWEIEDDGGTIPKASHDLVFEKLYRVPTGNQHDIKGFGIGLFYARSIVELHGGSLNLESAKDKTLFRITV